VGDNISLNEEFEDYAWVSQDSLPDYDLNSATIATLKRAGLIKAS
jgi:nucleoside triphosphatase